MTVKFGFFNSKNGDRLYDAEDMLTIIEFMVKDGIFEKYGNKFYVGSPFKPNLVTIDVGAAWLDGKWIKNTDKMEFTLPGPDAMYSRIDAIVISVDKTELGRNCTIKTVSGTPSTVPKRPTLKKTSSVNEYALAYILRRANDATVAVDDISSVIGSETPFAKLNM